MTGTPAKLDRWASMLRNAESPVSLTDDESMDLSTLLTEAANELCRLPAVMPMPIIVFGDPDDPLGWEDENGEPFDHSPVIDQHAGILVIPKEFRKQT